MSILVALELHYLQELLNWWHSPFKLTHHARTGGFPHVPLNCGTSDIILLHLELHPLQLETETKQHVQPIGKKLTKETQAEIMQNRFWFLREQELLKSGEWKISTGKEDWYALSVGCLSQ